MPANLSASFPENGTFAGRTVAEFRVFAPSSTQPTGLVLNGADAEYFAINFDISPADAGGFRDVVVSINTSTQFDFEDPFDQNGDNTYEFTLTGQYLNQALRSDVTVNITDVLDAALIRPRIISGPENGILFGSPIRAIPDITGDGKAEIGVSLQPQLSTMFAYILRSDSFDTIPAGRDNVVSANNLLPRAVGLIRAGNGPTFFRRLNFLTAQPGPNGAGVDILTSESGDSGPYLIRVRGNPPSPNLSFDFRPDNAPNFDAYPLGVESRPISLLIPDVSGDGIADIFVRYGTNDPANRRFGIIFGKATGGLPSNWVQAPFDITFEISEEVFFDEPYFLHHPVVKPIGDLDSDGLQELVISFPQFIGTQQNNRRHWIIRGSALSAAVGGSINLESLDPADGIRREGQLDSVFELPDLGSAGNSRFVLASDDFFQVVDESVLLGPSAPPPPAGTLARVNLLRQGLAIGSRAILLPDLDGDDIDEVLAVSRVTKVATIIRGSAIRDAVNSGVGSFQLQEQSLIDIDFRGVVGYARVDSSEPVLLEDSDAIVFGFASLDSGPPDVDTSGRIVIIPLSRLRSDIQAGQPRIDLK